jgi:CheY-like chemotaxis protein
MASPVASPAKACILLADDSQLVRNAIKNLLADLNPTWEIFEAENGADALEKTLALNPDVAMLGLNLPDIRGETLAQQIRQLSPFLRGSWLSHRTSSAGRIIKVTKRDICPHEDTFAH